MATLQNTTIAGGGYYRVGDNTNAVYFSGGSSLGNEYAMFGLNTYWNGTQYIQSGSVIDRMNIQIGPTTIDVISNDGSTFGTVCFSVQPSSAVISSTTTQLSPGTSKYLGVGAAHSGFSKIRIDGNSTSNNFLAVNNCAGFGSADNQFASITAFYGFLGITIGSSVGPAAGLYYIRLWGTP
jgi:hypothetical protein